MWRRGVEYLASMRFGVWLLGIQLVLLLCGAVQMPAMQEYESMNDVSLLVWMRHSPIKATWWLWLSVGALSLLALNTLLCSAESLGRKRQGRHWLLVVSPQVMHLGFLFMLLAHLVSASSAMKGLVRASEGSRIELPSGVVLEVEAIGIEMSPAGFPLDWSADVTYRSQRGGALRADRIAPNRPSFMDGLGVYLKMAQPYPEKSCVIEVSREPGAPWALAGGLLFTIGTVMLLALKVARER